MVEVSVLDPKARPYKARTERMLALLLEKTGNGDKMIECSLVGDAQIPKNVLSFPATGNFPRPDLAMPTLGELYLNPAYIKKHHEDFELMVVHGFLHLLGYDHARKNDRIRMEKKERELLRQIAKSK